MTFFRQREEVDKERFVKLFLAGVKQAAGLSKAGLAIVEVVYNLVRENPNSDEVKLKASPRALINAACASCWRRNSSAAALRKVFFL